MQSKVSVFLILSTISSACFSAATSVCTNYPGVYICENGRVDNIKGTYGSVILESMEVNGMVYGNIGALNIKGSKINQIDGNIGSFVAASSIFSGKLAGNIGTIQLKKSTLNEIDVHAATIDLINSTVEKITIANLEKKIKVNINNRSVITGDVYFPENIGEVCIDDSSKLKGSVINGKIIRGSC